MLGTALGPYRIDRELGSGGMGKVYAAVVVGRAPGLAEGTRVALKVVHPHLLDTPGFFKRFLREGEIGRSVVHENVVRTYDCDAVRESHFLVMEYVEGQTLRALLDELERVPEELCRHIGREVAKGLAAIHAAGVLHRDVKPENVLITNEHVVKVMDLGVARLNDEALRLSQTGAFVGSIHYAAPECFGLARAAGASEDIPRSREGAARSAEGEGVDHRADLHSLGLVLYELSCGTNPYFADSVPEVLKKVLHETPRRLGDVNPQLSPFFEEVVHCLLAKKPADRFADAATLLAVLEDGEKSAWWAARAKAIRAATRQPLRRIRIPRETAVYGRESELARLRVLFEKAKTGDGQVVVVAGEAGIGKSRVVDELIGCLQRDGEDLNFLFGSYPPGGAATAAGAFSTAFREQFGADGSAAYLVPTPVLVPAFDALLRGEPTPTGVEALTKDSLQTCFVHATRGLAAERTTVLLIDDLHFATEDARSLFTSVALAVPGHRILVVGTTRPGIDEKWLAGLTRLPQTSHMQIERLFPKDLTALLEDSLRSESLALSLAGQIAQKSDGNPFFVFEIIRGLRDGQFLTQKDDGTWVSTRVIDDIKIPSSILDLVNARVAELSEEERDLLDVACCWGFEFDATQIGDALGQPRIPTLKRFSQIEKRHRLVRCAGERFVFDHHQVQEALYRALPPQLAREYHAALAGALETRAKCADEDPATLDGALCVDLCEHLLKGAQGERSLRYLDAAFAHLWKGYLNDAAIRLADRALAVPGLLAGQERARMCLRKAARLDLLGRRDAERAALDEAQALADATGDLALRAQVRARLGWHLKALSLYAEAEATLRDGIGLARAAGDEAVESHACGSLGNVLSCVDRNAEAREQLERAIALARARGDRQTEAIESGNLGLVFQALGRFADARVHHERNLAFSRERGDLRMEAIAGSNVAILLHLQGRHAEAVDGFERTLTLARAVGDRISEATTTGGLGSAFLSLGRYAEAREQFERHLALSRDAGDPRGEAIALVNLGPANRLLGDIGVARRRLDESLALCRKIGIRYPEGYGLLDLGRLADDEDDAVSALRLMEASLELRRGIGHRDGAAESLLAIGNVRLRAGDADSARTAIDEALRLFREQGRAAQAAQALAVLACLPGGDPAAAVAALDAASEGECAMPTRWSLWQATGDRTHLAAAKRLLDESLGKVPAEHHAAMLANVRLNRDIAAAAKAAGL